MTRLPLPEPKKYFGIDAEPDFTYYTASQMREYSDAENAALREQVRVLRDALESIKHDSEFFSVSHLRSLAKIALEQTK